ncbi:single-stranded-DNA-specific exonuclease C-terminal domain-containing protein, partial [Paenibacillus sonchi]|uniref:single-stranded-DNA-specific exonuclease C-terminal domain-containing protein n=1 Tax=Paenibacillus sonchi TaxID=373687 RepID=UPI001ADED7D7
GSRNPQLMLQDLAVPKPQLFDLRGAADAVKQAAQLHELLKPYSGAKPLRTAAVFQNSRLSPMGALQGMSLWVYDEDAGISPVRHHPADSEDAQVSLLCLLDMPETPEQLDALLAAFPQADNIALLHSIRDGRDRLQMPTRDHFKVLYKSIAALATAPVPEHELLRRLTRQSSMGMRMLAKMLDVFEELEFIDRSRGTIMFVTQPSAKSLTASQHFVRLGKTAEMEQYFMESSRSELQEWMLSRRLDVSRVG